MFYFIAVDLNKKVAKTSVGSGFCRKTHLYYSRAWCVSKKSQTVKFKNLQHILYVFYTTIARENELNTTPASSQSPQPELDYNVGTLTGMRINKLYCLSSI